MLPVWILRGDDASTSAGILLARFGIKLRFLRELLRLRANLAASHFWWVRSGLLPVDMPCTAGMPIGHNACTDATTNASRNIGLRCTW